MGLFGVNFRLDKNMKKAKKNFEGYKSTYRFNASHTFSTRDKIHSHTFWVRLYIERDTMQFVEFFKYESAIKKYFDEYSGKCLNDTERFLDLLPTLENISKVFFEDIKNMFEDSEAFRLIKLEVGDGPVGSVSIGNGVIAGDSDIYIEDSVFEEYRKMVLQ